MTGAFTTLVGQAPLLAAWGVTSVAVSLLLAATTALLHRVSRGAMPSRVPWALALITTVALTLSQPWRQSAAVALPAPSMPVPSGERGVVTAETSRWERATQAVAAVPHMAQRAIDALSRTASAAVRRAPHGVQVAFVLGWPAASAVLLLIGVWSYRRQRRLVQRAHRLIVHGQTVHVTEQSGPAVHGILHPRIVVPTWLLQRAAHEQRLVVAHEQAHIAAHDPALLLAACVLTVLIPWNPVAWYLLARLRLAIELDCDTRVLQAGVTPRHYGALLIDLSAAATPAPLLTGATAFSHHASHLERRLHRMTDRPTSHKQVRRLSTVSLAALALAAACGAELPTSAELQGMDVASAEKRAFVTTPDMTTESYVVNGKVVTEQEAKAIAADRIASIEIQKKDSKRSVVRIRTQDKPAMARIAQAAEGTGTVTVTTAATSDSTPRARIMLRADGTGDSTRTLVMDAQPLGASAKLPPLIFLDGARVSEDAMKKLSPDRIERVEVIKGAAAEKLYGPDGAKGVIVITTKK